MPRLREYAKLLRHVILGAKKGRMLQTGNAAPAFSVSDESGQVRTLDEFRSNAWMRSLPLGLSQSRSTRLATRTRASAPGPLRPAIMLTAIRNSPSRTPLSRVNTAPCPETSRSRDDPRSRRRATRSG